MRPAPRFVPYAACALLVATAAVRAASFTVVTADDGHDAAAGDGNCADALGACTLRAAIEEANALAGADEVVMPPGRYVMTLPGSDPMGGESLLITSDLTVTGAGNCETVIDAQERSRVLIVRGAGAVRLSGLALTRGQTSSGQDGPDPWGGGALRIEASDVVVSGCALEDNDAWHSFGSAAWLVSGRLTIERTTFAGNATSGVPESLDPPMWMAAVVGGFGDIVLRDCSFAAQPGAWWADGGIGLGAGTLTVSRCRLGGVGVYVVDGVADISDVAGDTLDLIAEGGMLLARGLDADSLHVSCSAQGATCSVTDSMVRSGGTMSVHGGALVAGRLSGGYFTLRATAGTADVTDVQFGRARNHRPSPDASARSGGAAEIWGGTLRFERCAFTEASSDRGGGVFIGQATSASTDVTMSNCTIARNRATSPGSGGGILIEGGALHLFNCTIAGNVAEEGGGGGIAVLPGATVEAAGTLIADNAGPAGDDDCVGILVSRGHDLVEAASCVITGDATGLVTGVDPALAPAPVLSGRGVVLPLLPGSIARDALPVARCVGAAGLPLERDARRIVRPQDGDGSGSDECDLGAVEMCADARDTDGDTIGDACDACPLLFDDQTDRDGDGVGDACDTCAGSPGSPADADGDGIGDTCDACPGTANPDQADCDADGIGDACDATDSDGDGTPDASDTCPCVGAAQADTDGDGIGDACDLCPDAPDPAQEDADGDRTGNACDACPGLAQPECSARADADADGVGDACDDCPSAPDPGQTDMDADGIGDACDSDCASVTSLVVRTIAPGLLQLDWLSAGSIFDVHRGTIASLAAGIYDHGAFGACSTGPSPLVVADASGSNYYVVASRCGGLPGVVGLDSLGRPAPPGDPGCP